MKHPGPAFLDSVREALRSLVRARLRTLLGLAGITVGIASVIAMISAGEVATAESRKEFEALGTDIVTIEPRPGQRKAGIPLDAALAFAETLPTVSEAAARIELRRGASYVGKQVGHGSVQGVSAAFAVVNRLVAAEGRFVSDMDKGRFFAVVGADVAGNMRRLGRGEVLGEFVRIDDRLYTVVGVLADAPETYALPFRVGANESVFVPITTLRRIKPSAGIGLVVARTAPGVHHSEAVRDANAYFARRARGLELDIVSAEQLIQQMESQVGLMTLLLGAVGSIALLVGGIGVMNIMLISVTERRREIGLRRALGASRGNIQRQFLIEALMLAICGGLAGIVVGTGAAYGLCWFFEWEFFLSSTSMLTGLGVSTAVGLFFGFQPAYLAAIMDAWSRRIVGYALGRRIDARLTLAALTAAIESRNPPPGCIHHSDRGSQYAAQAYRTLLGEHGLVGSMGRRGNPYDNAMMESFMKTLKVEGVYPMAFESAEDVAEHLPRFIDSYNERRLHSALGYLSPNRFEENQPRTPVKTAA